MPKEHHLKESMTNHLQTPSAKGGFRPLGLSEPILRAIQEENYEKPTPIQEQSIPHLLEGKDLMGCAQTGTGKTAAFALPILNRLEKYAEEPRKKEVRTLILTPTRELALQIAESFSVYGRYLGLRQAVVFGGVGPVPQIKAMRRGLDVLVATPGRLLDLYNQGHCRLDQVEMFVLDEADRMLDMGFLPDVRKLHNCIRSTPQSMLFSATLPKEIVQLTDEFLNDPVMVSVNPPSSTVEKIDQQVLFVDRENKGALLESVLKDKGIVRALVFTRTKHGANRIAKNLSKNRIYAEAFHGNKSQSARLLALKNFRSGKARVLVATDVASRGLDVDGITHVINYELPKEAESYVHRIGRTARAGASGVAISFCDAGERSYLRKIERVINRNLGEVVDHPFPSTFTRIKKNGSHGPKKVGEHSQERKPGAFPQQKKKGASSNWKSSRPGNAKAALIRKRRANNRRSTVQTG